MLKTNYKSNPCLLLETDLRWLLWRLGLLRRALKSGLWPVIPPLRTWPPPWEFAVSGNTTMQCLVGLIDVRASPTTEGLDGNGIGLQVMFAPIQIAGTSNGDTLGHGIEASLAFKFLLKRLTTCFQQGDIRFTVLHHFSVKIKHDVATNLVATPTKQFLLFLGHHTIGIVKFQIGDPAHLLLMVGGIE